ncbi:regulatory protein, luxR family [Actinopolyspora xinjiangensis]|uniref:Regulatory protein, luxR family n=1 Tax=Actinopolyspora xinjiangensis TaxID=405564 RepID=A0A1H0Q336_9ACTN|nr:regulatory protein, luxR family [Actinopolyspora xinjiangensis]
MNSDLPAGPIDTGVAVRRVVCGSQARDWHLTDREVDVLANVAAGYTSEQIADALSISVHTVIRHISNMQHRCGAPNRMWLVSRAYCAGVLVSGAWPPVASDLRCLGCVHSYECRVRDTAS